MYATPTIAPSQHTNKEKMWSVEDSKAYTKGSLGEWQYQQWICLNNLWTKESNWRTDAYNKVKVMGKNAGGIPQLLGLNPELPATIQIDRGLDYIFNRYGTPCKAWEYWNKNGHY